MLKQGLAERHVAVAILSSPTYFFVLSVIYSRLAIACQYSQDENTQSNSKTVFKARLLLELYSLCVCRIGKCAAAQLVIVPELFTNESLKMLAVVIFTSSQPQDFWLTQKCLRP